MRIGVCVALAFVAGCKGSSAENDLREGDAKKLPDACVTYRQVLERLPQCEAMSKQELAALWQGYQDASTAWVNRDVSRMPANTLRAIDVACARGRDYVRERIAAQCPDRVELAERDLFGNASKLPTSCVVYSRYLDVLVGCHKLPRASRDALKQGYEAMAQAWRDVDSMSSEALESLDEGCRAAADAIRQAGSATGCEMPITIPQQCEDYRATIMKVQQCTKLPQQTRDALRQGYEAMVNTRANAGDMPPEARAALADACKQGTDALKQAVGATCGW